MHEFSLDFLRCVKCGSKLELDVFCKDKEIDEGFLECKKCHLQFPIINKIPIIWNDFSKYLSSRIILGRKLFQTATHEKMKRFLKDSISAVIKGNDDRTALEEKWSRIYQTSKNSKFYKIVKSELREIPNANLVLDYGCSIGLMTNFLADYNEVVFGIDRSYGAISIAKKTQKKNLDYFISDFMSLVFGNAKFDIILALNVLELIEPNDLLKHASRQIQKGSFVLSDPYDYDRGKNSVKSPLDAMSLRKNLGDLGFTISSKTRTPSFIPWTLNLNSRCTLNYKVDFVVATK